MLKCEVHLHFHYFYDCYGLIYRLKIDILLASSIILIFSLKLVLFFSCPQQGSFNFHYLQLFIFLRLIYNYIPKTYETFNSRFNHQFLNKHLFTNVSVKNVLFDIKYVNLYLLIMIRIRHKHFIQKFL
jgi:hypothetical protein